MYDVAIADDQFSEVTITSTDTGGLYGDAGPATRMSNVGGTYYYKCRCPLGQFGDLGDLQEQQRQLHPGRLDGRGGDGNAHREDHVDRLHPTRATSTVSR